MEIKACMFVSLIAIFFFIVSVNANAQEKPEMLYRISVSDERGNNKYGFIDKTGKVIIPPIYSEAGEFSEGLAYVKNDDRRCGYIDTTGKFIIEPQFYNAGSFSEGLAAIVDPDGTEGLGFWSYIDKSGKRVITLPEWIPSYPFPFIDGLALVTKDGKWGYIDKTGKIAIEAKFDFAYPFSEGLAKVRVGDKYGFIDKTGKIVIEPQFPRSWTVNILGKRFPADYDSPFRNGLALIQRTDESSFTGFIDKTGKKVIDLRPNFNAYFSSFSEGFVQVRDENHDVVFFDTNGNAVFKEGWRAAEDFSEGLAAVEIRNNSRQGCENNNCWGYIDKKGSYAIKPQFSSVRPFRGGLAWVSITIPRKDYSDSYKLGYIDKTGKFVWFTIKK